MRFLIENLNLGDFENFEFEKYFTKRRGNSCGNNDVLLSLNV